MNLNAASYDLTPLTFPLWSLLRIFLYFVTSGHCLLSARDINVAQLSLSHLANSGAPTLTESGQSSLSVEFDYLSFISLI